MSQRKISINGVIVYDVNDKKYSFKDYLEVADFTDGVFQSKYSHYVLVGEHTITAALPDGFDTIKPQLDSLDRQEHKLTLQYQQALNHIKVQRNNLLALEHTPAPEDDPNFIPF